MKQYIASISLLLSATISLGAAQITTVNGIQWTEAQAPMSTGATPAAFRSILTNAFDNDTVTFFSLGWGGSMTGLVQGGLVFDRNAGAIEITYNSPNAAYPEAAKFVLSNTAEPGTAEFELINSDVAGPEDQCTGESAGLTCSFSLDQGANVWSILLPVGSEFNKIVITDTTPTRFGASYQASGIPSEGFDVGEVRFNPAEPPLPPQEIPEPATYAMMAAGLLGVALIRRRS